MIDTWKYGLSIDGARGIVESMQNRCIYTDEELRDYLFMVRVCHDSVESYLDTHPEIVPKFRTSGYRYFDILKLANPEYSDKVTEWSLNHKVRKEQYFEKVKSYGKIFRGRIKGK